MPNPFRDAEPKGTDLMHSVSSAPKLFVCLAAAAALFTTVGTARAATYYVDNSCANAGDGLSDRCADAPGAPGRFNDLHACDLALNAGDTCLVGPGMYWRNAAYEGRPDLNTGFHPVNSGAPGAPITYRAKDPNNWPLVCSGPNCDDECSYTNSALGVNGTSWAVFDGFLVKGSITAWGNNGIADNVVFRNIDVSHGWTFGNTCNGDPDRNWAAVRLEKVTNFTLENSYIHDVWRGFPDRGEGVKIYDTDHALFDHITIAGTWGAGFEAKSTARNIEFRYSKVVNTGGPPLQGANQLPPNGGDVYHHLLLVCGDHAPDFDNGGIMLPTDETIQDIWHHVTMYNCGIGFQAWNGTSHVRAWLTDNIFHLKPQPNSQSIAFGFYGPGSDNDVTVMDHNAYNVPQFSWNTQEDGNRQFWDLASWQDFWRGRGRDFDSHSQVVDCGFVAPTVPACDGNANCSGDFHVTNPVCRTLGYNGKAVGAYEDDATCLGYGCASAPQAGLALVDRSRWSVRWVDSQETAGENGAASNVFDGNPATFWHTEWSGGNPAPPHEVQVDLGETVNVAGLRMLPRQDGCNHGFIGRWEMSVSDDDVNWGDPVVSGAFANDAAEKEVTFPSKTGRFIRFRAWDSANGDPWTSVAELNILRR